MTVLDKDWYANEVVECRKRLREARKAELDAKATRKACEKDLNIALAGLEIVSGKGDS